MGDHPDSNNVRGNSLDPLDILDERSRANHDRLTKLERWQITTTESLNKVENNTNKLVNWLDGTNGTDGFRVTWAVAQRDIAHLKDGIQERTTRWGKVGYIILGAIIVSGVGLIWSVIVDFIHRTGGTGP